MLTSDYPRDGAEMKMAERCQPDYETMIARLNERLTRETRMRDALLEYLRGKTVDGKMAELVGEIVTRCNSFQCELDGLIKRQEENKK